MLAGLQPAPAKLAFILSIRRLLHSQSLPATRNALIGSKLLILTRPKNLLCVHSALISSAPPARPNPHSAPGAPVPCGSARPLPPDAISCLGAFQPPVDGARG